MSKKRDGLEPDVIVSMLKRTSLPTLLVEGSGDRSIYRWLEGRLGVGELDILPCGGRPDLLRIYSRRDEFSDKPVLFLADLDDFIYFGIPIEYRDIIFTTGYSIENDVLYNNVVDFLLDPAERIDFTNVMNRMIEIYSRKVQLRSSNPSEDLSVHANSFYDFDRSAMKPSNPFNGYTTEPIWFGHIYSDPRLLLRGKNLMSIYTGILSKSSRGSKYSRENIIELHLKQNNLPDPIAETVSRIRDAFKKLGVAF